MLITYNNTTEWPPLLSKNKSKIKLSLSKVYADKIIECGSTLECPQYLYFNIKFQNKCFICVFLYGYQKIDSPAPVSMQNIIDNILELMIIYNIDVNEMIDTYLHKDFIKKSLKEYFDITNEVNNLRVKPNTEVLKFYLLKSKISIKSYEVPKNLKVGHNFAKFLIFFRFS